MPVKKTNIADVACKFEIINEKFGILRLTSSKVACRLICALRPLCSYSILEDLLLASSFSFTFIMFIINYSITF